MKPIGNTVAYHNIPAGTVAAAANQTAEAEAQNT